jgi:hypothetical protein
MVAGDGDFGRGGVHFIGIFFVRRLCGGAALCVSTHEAIFSALSAIITNNLATPIALRELTC